MMLFYIIPFEKRFCSYLKLLRRVGCGGAGGKRGARANTERCVQNDVTIPTDPTLLYLFKFKVIQQRTLLSQVFEFGAPGCSRTLCELLKRPMTFHQSFFFFTKVEKSSE